MSNPERVMLLIDADNVSVDVMEQALHLVHRQHGGVHVRRAYCTAESAVKHQAAFKRMAIKPMVNLSAGKNSTDIALAVDAIDLVLAERPDVVVIASSDSDFAPLVQRLREKGCTVRGIGQSGKTGAETVDVYDDFTVLEHRGGTRAAAEPAAKAPAKRAAAKKAAANKAAAKEAASNQAVSKEAVSKEAPSKKAPARKAARTATATPAAATTAAAAKPAPARTTAAKKAAPAKKAAAARKAPAKKATAAATAAEAAPAADTVVTPPVAAPSSPDPAAAAAPARPDAAAVLACLPELAEGRPLALNVAVQRLREARLLGRNTPSTKFFAALGERFVLEPAAHPSKVRLAG